MTFSKNYLSNQSQPWAREVTKRIVNIENAFRSAEVNNTTRDDQLASSFRRLDANVLATQAATEDALDAINKVLGLGEPDGDPIDGSNVIDDSLPGAKIVADSITANEISSNYIYAGTIDANQINAGTLVGFTIKTKSTGQRVELNTSDIEFFDTNGAFTGSIQGVATTSVGATIRFNGPGNAHIRNSNDTISLRINDFGGPTFTLSDNGLIGDTFFDVRDGRIAVTKAYSGIRPEFVIRELLSVETPLYVNENGQFEAFGFRATNNMNVGGDLFASLPVGSGSTVRVTSGNKFVKSSSSLRYKQDVVEAEIDYDLLASMNVKTFKFKNDVEKYGEDAQKIYGFIAEELHDLGLLDFVIYEELEDGTKRPDGIKQDSIFAATYKLVQIQSEKIKNLESTSNNLTRKIKELENDYYSN